MHRTEVPRSATLDEACDRFMSELRGWVEDCLEEHAEAPLLGPGRPDGHDQLTYTTSWATLIRRAEDERVLAFMKRERDRIRAHYEACGAWHHGYWKHQEAHHGTEHFELFLGTLLELDPNDTATLEQLHDAAEHFGNWVEAVPAFFDWETGLFRSVYLGTAHVGEDESGAINTADHVRFVNIALQLFEATGEPRYMELAASHMRRWASGLVEAESIPLALLPEGPVELFDERQAATYRGFAGAAGIVQATAIAPIDRAENMLASGAAQALLRMWRHTRREMYRRAAERLIDELARQLGDPDAGAVAATIRDYRELTGDRRYDEAVIAAVEPAAEDLPRELALDAQQRLGRSGGGVGKRPDMPRWLFEGEAPRPLSPITLLLAGELAEREAWLISAVDLACAHFTLARQAFDSGREHGCAARSVSAVARGHGRDNHAGMVTAVLEPALRML